MEFEGQQDGERVLRVFRKHLLSLLTQLVMPILLIVAGLFLATMKWVQGIEWLGLGVGLVGVFQILNQTLKWYFTIYILTNYRVRFIDQKGLFSRASIDFFFQDINSVSLSVNGVLAEFFHFGDVLIEARAGELLIKRLSKVDNFYNSLQNSVSQSRKVE